MFEAVSLRIVPMFQIYFVCKVHIVIMYQKSNWLVNNNIELVLIT